MERCMGRVLTHHGEGRGSPCVLIVGREVPHPEILDFWRREHGLIFLDFLEIPFKTPKYRFISKC